MYINDWEMKDMAETFERLKSISEPHAGELMVAYELKMLRNKLDSMSITLENIEGGLWKR